jgi:hypothetical protein
MRKWAVVGLIFLIIAVWLICMAWFNALGFRDWAYKGIQGTLLAPIHDRSISLWMTIGDAGFTYIAAATMTIAIGGGLFLVLIIYGLLWKKGIKAAWDKHKGVPTDTGLGTFRAQGAPAPPEAAPQTPAQETPTQPQQEEST